MQVKNGKIMFCYCCSNGGLDGNCIYGWEDKCGITNERLNKIFNKKIPITHYTGVGEETTLIEGLKRCGELPWNFEKFKIAKSGK